ICISNTALILKLDKQTASTAHVFTRFAESADAREKETDVVLNASLKTAMPCLLVVKTGSRKFSESGIDILFPAFRNTEASQQNTVIIVKLALQCVISTKIKLRSRFSIDAKRFSVSHRCFFYHRTV